MARLLIYPSLNSLEAVAGTCDLRRLWSDCANAQADLSLRWPHMSYCRFCRAQAHIARSLIGLYRFPDWSGALLIANTSFLMGRLKRCSIWETKHLYTWIAAPYANIKGQYQTAHSCSQIRASLPCLFFFFFFFFFFFLKSRDSISGIKKTCLFRIYRKFHL